MQATPVVLAGNAPIQTKKDKDRCVDEMQTNDPWARYNPTRQGADSGNAASASVPTAATRRLEGPVEQKFDQRAQEIANMKQEVLQIKEGMAKQNTKAEERFEGIKQEFTLIRGEAKQQAVNLTTTFNESIAKAIKSQETSLTRQFEDLKTLIQSQQAGPNQRRLHLARRTKMMLFD